MASLVAIGKNSKDRWEREIPPKPVLLGRLPESSEWATPWDLLISRKHATLIWADGQLQVRREATARNPILFRGRQVDDFSVGIGDQFTIGETTFEVRENAVPESLNLPSPATEFSLGAEELQAIRFPDADVRIDVLAALPGVIRNAPSDAELEGRVIDVLLSGIPRAQTAAVVWMNPASRDKPEIHVRSTKSRSITRPGEFRPSGRLIADALQRRRQMMLHLWNPGAGSSYTADLSFDWAVCAPLPDEPEPGWALYVAGSMDSTLTQIAESLQKERLKPDLKFVGVVADVYGALRQLLYFQRREAQLAIFLPEPVRAALADRDLEKVLAPKEADVTVLFCDLRGSCRMGDDSRDDPSGLWDRVSEALGIMTSAIIDQGGVIGDFQGDAAMGFWGWPVSTPDQSERAARAALAIRRKFAQASLQKGRALSGFNCGIGIATGRVIAGRLGTFDQAKVSVYGPRVNLAARLESMTKLVQVPILLDDCTAQALASRGTGIWARIRRLATVVPYGMRTPCRSDCASLADSAKRPRGRPACSMSQQPEAARPRLPQLQRPDELVPRQPLPPSVLFEQHLQLEQLELARDGPAADGATSALQRGEFQHHVGDKQNLQLERHVPWPAEFDRAPNGHQFLALPVGCEPSARLLQCRRNQHDQPGGGYFVRGECGG
jgi:adenylate cyclase